MGVWMGGVISTTIVHLFSGYAKSDGGLKAFYSILHILDIVTLPSALGTFVTGVLLAWLTAWGFFKYKWVIYTESVVVLDGLLAIFLGGSAASTLDALVEAEGLSAMQNPEYVSAWNMLAIQGIVTSLLLASAAFVSVLKPWRKREGAEPTT